ncbi:MAG: sulfatase-like hydrolase/transferase [Verrucomicrobiales bacterium]
MAQDPEPAASRPNILFLFADDLSYEVLGFMGNREVATPHLDALAAKGTVFTHAYNMGSWSGAVCVASRHMLNTGLSVWRAEKAAAALASGGRKKNGQPQPTSPGDPNFKEKGWLWSQLMAAAGYETCFTGKWHVNADPKAIFQQVGTVRAGMPKDTKEGYNRPLEGLPDPWSPSDPKFGGYWEGGTHWSVVVANEAIGFLESARAENRPHFMYVAFNAAHDPRQAPQSYIDRYPASKVAVPEDFLPEYPWAEPMASGRGLRDEKLAPFPRTRHAVQVNRQEYFALISHLDDQIGRIVAALEKSGKADKTWIFFTADHGLAVGHHGLMGKQNPFDHSIRVPFFVVGPGVKAGQRLDAPIYLQDVMPTSLELAGTKVPDRVEFHSLLPLLKGDTGNVRSRIYQSYLKNQRGLVRGDYKLVLYPTASKMLLFNLKEDPMEMHDLAADPASAATLRSLFLDLLEEQKSLEDSLDLRKAFPGLAP